MMEEDDLIVQGPSELMQGHAPQLSPILETRLTKDEEDRTEQNLQRKRISKTNVFDRLGGKALQRD